MKNKKVILVFLIIIFVAIIAIILYLFNKNNSYNENLFDIARINEEIVTQGDVVVYEFQEEISTILDDAIKVQVLNINDVVVGEATVKNNRILVDTSPLLYGRYKIKILYNSQEMIVKDEFSVIIIEEVTIKRSE